MTIEQHLSAWTQQRFASLFPDQEAACAQIHVVPTTDSKFGNYQCNAAMGWAKLLKSAPRAIAEQVTNEWPLHELVEKIELAGPGFINIYLKADALAQQIVASENDESYGVPNIGQGRKVILDFSSPNVAKPLHIAHIRSTIIGSTLYKLHNMTGYEAISDNHLGDWGTQFGLILLGYKNFINEEALAEDPITELERVYVESYNKSKEDETWYENAKKELVKLQGGDAENKALWEKFIELSMGEFDRMYKRLGVHFDLVRGESFYNEMLPGVLEQLSEKQLVVESEGAQIVNLEDEKLGVCIVQKQDGGFNYATTDLATVKSRLDEFDPAKIIYVTDERQQLHFKQFFRVAEKMGWEADLEHIWFGLMRLPEGTFSTREGNVIKLGALLDEAETRALALLENSDMDAATKKDVARAVGIGAVKYADLSQNPQSLVTFTWDKAMALDGNSAPYLQYAHARICSVLDKYKAQFPDNNLDDYDLKLESDIEKDLALTLLQFPEAILKATASYRPNVIADYLFGLAQAYSRFYQNMPFLKAEEGVRESRLRLCRHVARVMHKGLDVLGIEAPERI